jgi:hydroxymethylpyrimidine pyrophosphatase-like HAD family hydrolase
MKFLFDIDGTLANRGEPISKEFLSLPIDAAVVGGGRLETILPRLNGFGKEIFFEMGNGLWDNGLVYLHKHTFPKEIFEHFTGDIDVRNSMLNVKVSGDRVEIAERFNIKFPDYECLIGGKTSVDIVPKGMDKRSAVKYLGDVVFIGDMCEKHGNDHAAYISAKRAFKTSGPDETLSIVKRLLNNHNI